MKLRWVGGFCLVVVLDGFWLFCGMVVAEKNSCKANLYDYFLVFGIVYAVVELFYRFKIVFYSFSVFF